MERKCKINTLVEPLHVCIIIYTLNTWLFTTTALKLKKEKKKIDKNQHFISYNYETNEKTYNNKTSIFLLDCFILERYLWPFMPKMQHISHDVNCNKWMLWWRRMRNSSWANFFPFSYFWACSQKKYYEVDFISVGQRVFVFNDLLFSKQLKLFLGYLGQILLLGCNN